MALCFRAQRHFYNRYFQASFFSSLSLIALIMIIEAKNQTKNVPDIFICFEVYGIAPILISYRFFIRFFVHIVVTI